MTKFDGQGHSCKICGARVDRDQSGHICLDLRKIKVALPDPVISKLDEILAILKRIERTLK